jgi:hypothetical protein
MSNALGWVIKLVSWFSIYFIIAWQFDGDMPFWAYFIVILLCSIVQGVVEHFVKKKKDDKGDKTE